MPIADASLVVVMLAVVRVKRDERSEGIKVMNDKNKNRIVLIVVAVASMTLGALGTGYALRLKSIKPDFTLTVNTNTTTIKMVDEEGNSLGEIRNWTADSLVVRIERYR